MTAYISRTVALAALATAAAALGACSQAATEAAEPAPTGTQTAEVSHPHVAAADKVAAGDYFALVGGCNDCHTAMWPETNGAVPPEDRFLGVPIGWRGPWGTSYAPNLRLSAAAYTEDEWIEMIRTREGLPPMPWMNVKAAAEEDLRAMHAYLTSLGPAGETMPAAVPPGVTPQTLIYELTPHFAEPGAPAATE